MPARWRGKRGTSKWNACTFIDSRPIRTLKRQGPCVTHRRSQQPPREVLISSTRSCAAGLLLQARGLQTHPEIPGERRGAPGDPLVDGAAPLEGRQRPPTAYRLPRRWTRPFLGEVRARAVTFGEPVTVTARPAGSVTVTTIPGSPTSRARKPRVPPTWGNVQRGQVGEDGDGGGSFQQRRADRRQLWGHERPSGWYVRDVDCCQPRGVPHRRLHRVPADHLPRRRHRVSG